MNRDFLGDYLDHFKGGVIRLLPHVIQAEVLGVPLPTDEVAWPEQDMRLYEQLVGIPERRVRWSVGDQCRFPRSGEDRTRYFESLANEAARFLFLDPDTGIKFSDGDSRVHIRVTELKQLVDGHPDRGLIVYQHAGRRVKDSDLKSNMPEWLEKYTRFTFERLVTAGFTVATYPAAQASVFFISTEQGPVQELAAPINATLGNRRIYGL